MSLLVDVMHLVVIVAGLAIGSWALVGLRRSLPRGRFAVFGAGSLGSLFGCAALAGEVGVVPPAAWFVMIMAGLVAVATIGARTGRPAARTV